MEEETLKELKKATEIAKQLADATMRNHKLVLSMRSRLVVLTVLHKEELEGMGFNMDRWIRALEVDKSRINQIAAALKRK